jgi:lambda family phage portal protein
MADKRDAKERVNKDVRAPNPWDHRTMVTGEMASWRPPLTSWDNDIRPGFEVNRARARELALTNPYVANAVETKRDAIIGKKFSLVLLPNAEYLGVDEDDADAWATEAEAEWNRYAESITFDVDAKRTSTFTFLMHQVQEGMHTDGEVLGIVAWSEGPLGYGTCLQLIEPERLDDKNEQEGTGAETRYGIERNEHGAPIAYHIKDAHDADMMWSGPGKATKVTRYARYGRHGRPAVMHCYDEARPGQTRGISRDMLSSLKQAKMLAVFSEAELSRSIMSASWAAVIQTDMQYDQAMNVLGATGGDKYANNLTKASADYLKEIAPYYNKLGLQYNGARVAHLMPGDKLQIVQSQIAGVQHEAFEKAFLKQMAAGLGVSYEELSRDFSGMSYAAARQASEVVWRRYLRLRAMLNQKFCMQFVSAWMEEAITSGRLRMLGKKFEATRQGFAQARYGLCVGEFISWGRPVIDPVKETTGAHMRMVLGLSTLRSEAATTGDDFMTLIRQRAREATERAKYPILNPGGTDPSLVIGGKAPGSDGAKGKAARKDGPG